MRECALCGITCDSSVGMYRELKTEYWGGSKPGNIEYSPKIVTFFCSDQHRNEFSVAGLPGGEVQTDKWSYSGDD